MAPHHDFHSGAEARFLSADEGVSAWVGAAIAMVGMLVAACTIGAAAFFYQRHRTRSVTREVQKLQVKVTENGGRTQQAWSDPEVGGAHTETVIDKALPLHSDNPVVSDKLSASVRMELAETLRGIMEDEILRGLKASGISDRLDRLETQAKEQQVLSGSLLPPSSKVEPSAASSDLATTFGPSVASSGLTSPDWATTLKPEAKVLKRDQETLTELSLHDLAVLSEGGQSRSPDAQPSDIGKDAPRKDLTLSPSKRQMGNQDPPEKGWMHIDEDRSLRMSMVTVQKKLQQRDQQTQELHRQLRQTEQDCWNQKGVATLAAKRLQDLLSDPSCAPKVQAEELQTLRHTVEDLSGRLADSKQSDAQWQIVAKRQRAFFMQSERVAQEGVNLFRKHPAGELFLAPPPVYLEDDMDEDPRKPPWDIGSSHINPYVNDSWPFEPNACAQRCAVEPNLGRWDEEDGIESDSEDGSPASNASDAERAQLMLRLPQLPPESPHDEDFDPPEPTEPPEPLPALGALSSRSF